MWTCSKYNAESIDGLKHVLLSACRRICKRICDASREYVDRKACAEMKPETRHLHWMNLRVDVSESDTLLTPTTMKGTNIPSHAHKIAPGMNVVEMRFLADADGRSCTAYVYVTRKNDDICMAFSVGIASGKQVAASGRYYGDTLTVTDKWFEDKGVKIADAAGSDRMARLAFDALGYDRVFVLFDISSGVWSVQLTGF